MNSDDNQQRSVPLTEVYDGLTTRERNVMDVALNQYSGGTVRRGQEWLRCPGLGKTLYLKLKQKGMVLPEMWEPRELSCRAEHALRNANVDCDKTSVKQALLNGRLKPGKWVSYGAKTDAELRQWVGLPPLQKRDALYVPRRLWKFHPVTGEPITPSQELP